MLSKKFYSVFESGNRENRVVVSVLRDLDFDHGIGRELARLRGSEISGIPAEGLVVETQVDPFQDLSELQRKYYMETIDLQLAD